MPLSLRSLPRLLPVLLLPLLFGCGPGRNEFAPVCPNPIFLRELSDLTRYRPGSAGRDLTDLVLQAKLTSLRGECRPGSRTGTLDTTITVTMEVARGPAMLDPNTELPVFVAVTEGEEILNKQIYPVQVTFPSALGRVNVATPPLELTLPVGANRSGAAYGIIVGFQLTPEERETNRHRSGLR
ncbi:MAG: hypothetical protein AB7F35_02155 [Acetobacteraceae bacterium]